MENEEMEFEVGLVDIEANEHIEHYEYAKNEFDLALGLYDSFLMKANTYKYIYSKTLDINLLELSHYMKLELNEAQKRFIFDSLDLIESFEESKLEETWYIEYCDWKENYNSDGENLYEYKILDRFLQLIDCITSDFYKEIIEIK